jgi:enhancing lycopene biosynthesis protein 2
VEYNCFAPNKTFESINHINGTTHSGPRNVLEESARIARGKVKPLSELNPEQFRALFLPGGFGVARNLSTFATDNQKFIVDKEVEKALWGFFHAKKPIGACCIAPILLAKVFGTISGNSGIDLTLGKKGSEWPYSSVIDLANKFGNHLVECDVEDICKDRFHKIFSTPAYMKEGATPYEVYTAIGKLVDEIVGII